MGKIVGVALFGLLVGALVACSSGAEESAAQTGTAQEQLTGGCRLVCPKCHPNEVCPMLACAEDCHGKPATCVETMLCPIGYTWSQSACSCVPAP